MRNDRYVLLGGASCWHAIAWYGPRMSAGWDEPYGWLALATLCAWFVRRRGRTAPALAPRLGLPALLLSAYAASFAGLPDLLRGALAALALTTLACRTTGDGRVRPGALVLALLALPSLGALDHVLSWPLRRAVAELAGGALSLLEPTVRCDGVALALGEHLVLVDVPCSGIRMLWAGIYLAAAVACFRELGAWRSARAFAFACAVVLAANVVRAAVLFLVSTDRLRVELLGHAEIGALVFALAALLIVEGLRRGGREEASCAPR